MNFKGKKVLVRVDFNVPLSDEGLILDDTRMRAAIPTIQLIINQGGSVIIMSHLGRPLSKLNEDGSINKRKFSLKNLAKHLSSLLNITIEMASDCGGKDSQKKAKGLKPGEVLMLENTRFYEEEKKGDVNFAANLSQLADIYINDAFGTAHRAHASTATIAQFFDKASRGFGLLMQDELANAEKILNNHEKPFVAIIGGAKVSDKIDLIRNLMDKCDHICIGGGMAYTFHFAMGFEVGESLCESDKVDLARSILETASVIGCEIHLPTDSMVAREFSPLADATLVNGCNIPKDKMALDIGPETIKTYSEVIQEARTIIWNGPMGVFEFNAFSNGTFAIARAVAQATEAGAYSLVGGGDSVSAIHQSGLSEDISFISTGGGAMLELLEGKQLPGIEAITGTVTD